MRNKTDLRPYQQRFATHLFEHDDALCVARPGYGKTIAALTAIAELLESGIIRHALVIAPKRVARSVWPDEIAQWAHVAGMRYAVLTGPAERRRRQLRAASDRDLTIVGIDVVQWLVAELDQLDDVHCLFDLLVIDEISRFRDPKGKRAGAIAKRAHHWEMIWGMSGTLRPNGPLDLFMPARVVTRGKLWGRSFYTWRRERFYPTDFEQRNWTPLPDQEARINAELAPLVVTPRDTDTLDMPQLSVLIDKVELPPAARQQYDEMEKKLFMQHAEGHVVASSAAIATGKLAQMSNGFIYDDSGTHLLHDAKREWLEDIIEGAAGRPTLLIYEYLEDLRALRELLGPDLPVLGAGVSDKQSAANILDWNAGKLPFMALHPASGGHGLNLQHGGADMAWISPTWSAELWEQTIARLARSGQTQPVIVRVCVARNTVDELKLARVHGKMAAQEAFEAYLRQRATGIRNAA